MQVGIIGLLHESNTFIAEQTGRRHFHEEVLLTDEPVVDAFRDAPHEIGGFLQGLLAEDIEAVPLLAARATPHGPISDRTLKFLVSLVLRNRLETLQRLDGLLVAVHGAAVSESHLDADGYWLSQVRKALGPDKPIIGTLDLHANVSQQMIDATDALIGYRTNPHVDQRDRGLDAARLMVAALRGEIKPTQAAAFPPVAINIERQLTDDSPCRELYAAANEMLNAEKRVLSNSVLLGFPYADVPEMGSSVIVVTDNDAAMATKLAGELAAQIETSRDRFAGEFLSVEVGLDSASRLDGPVCLLDMGDNVGGGSPADGTALARAIHNRHRNGDNKVGSAFVCLADAPAAAKARSVGVGNTMQFPLGGKEERAQGPPLMVRADVIFQTDDGTFEETAVTHGGITKFDQGPTAIVRTQQGLTIMLTSRRMPPFSLRQLTAFGVDPSEYHLIVAKGVHAPRAAYRAACRHFLRVDTPGVTRADMTKLEYQHRRRPLFPFENW